MKLVDMKAAVKCVSIMDGSAAANYLQHFAPNEQGKYRVPLLTSSQIEYDNCLRLINTTSHDNDPANRVIYKLAILDTGILLEHPIFKKYIKKHIDFTGEGITDFNGHGSMVTWQYLATNSEETMAKLNIELYICKILEADGFGTEENIIKGLKWAESQNVRCINLSAGINNRRFFGLLDCNGTCEVCKAANNLKEKKILLFAAAGNDSETVCPAKVGLLFPDSLVISVGALDSSLTKKEAWSGEGNMYMPGTVITGGDVVII